MRLNRRNFLCSAAAAAIVARSAALRALVTDVDRQRWFRDAKFGMFIHWGPYSVAGVEASWPILRPHGEISEADYRALPQRFNPVRFDPEAWVALSQAAGQRYMVFTTKHHDGFCMFDSRYTSYKITRTPYGKDTLRMLSDACHAGKMPLGLYYSPPDMNHPGFRDTGKLSATNYRGEPERPEWPLYLDYMTLQLDELLTNYGPVAEVWFDSVDMKVQAEYDGQRFLDQIRRLQPAALVNNRLGIPADFVTPEQFTPKAIPVKGVRMDSPDHSAADRQAITVPRPEDFQPWETCMTINNTWAYNPKDLNFKSTETLIRTMIEVISRGGNFLLDVGPQPDGVIQPEFVDRLQAMGKWVRSNAAAIYGSTYGPIQGQAAFRTTARAASVYVFVMDRAAKEIGLTLPGRAVKSARLLATGKPLAFKTEGKTTTVAIDSTAWEQGIPVVELSPQLLASSGPGRS
jgi:alpha-L-fucosidase